MWEWKRTPDYTEIAGSGVVFRQAPLRLDQGDGNVLLRFADEPTVDSIGCGSVRVGLTAGGFLASVLVEGATV
ncbi:hypothetical protein FrEUN1fDRAFT_1827 [Parafrankia sp. EUN1f]|nr:hypothetical protein FrEUN1fDRAFT_1827 [Parafrankia sp. EUN1f]